MMEKFKVCPYCGAKNSTTVMACVECDGDISCQPVTTEDQIAPHVSDSAPIISDEKLVRICDTCGTHNLSNARKCISCGEDISDVLPCISCESEKQEHCTLYSIDGQYAFQLIQSETIIGREKQMAEYLKGKTYVSRTHCKISFEQEAIYLEDLNSSNHTYVNNKIVAKRTRIEDGDEISLGGITTDGIRQENAAYFIVKICECI